MVPYIQRNGDILMVEPLAVVGDRIAILGEDGLFWVVDQNVGLVLSFGFDLAELRKFVDRLVLLLAGQDDALLYREAEYLGQPIPCGTQLYIDLCDEAKINLPVG